MSSKDMPRSHHNPTARQPKAPPAPDTTDTPRPSSGDPELEAVIEEAFTRKLSLSTRQDSTWRGMPTMFGCAYAETTLTCTNGRVDVVIDTGVRVPAHRRNEADKLVMLTNSGLRLSGFAPVDEYTGEVVFAFSLDRSLVVPPPPEGASLQEQAEGTLSLCLGLALTSVRAYAPLFASIAYADARALDLADG